MQSENVEIKEINMTESKTIEKKEFEKVLIRQRNRELDSKAQNLIKLGCFNQTEETTVDFSKLEKCTADKQFKGVYDLYKDADNNLFYIYAKTESDSQRPYAYDVIAVETVTDEEYAELYKANSREGQGFIKGMFIVTFVMWALTILMAVVAFIYYMIVATKEAQVFDALTNAFISMTTYYVNIGIMSGILAITSISYRKFTGR